MKFGGFQGAGKWSVGLRGLWWVALVAVVSGWVAALGAERPASPQRVAAPPERAATVRVAVRGMAFDPASVEIRAGDTVEWTNEDLVAHTVTAPVSGPGGAFDSGPLAPGQSWRHTFGAAGNIAYVCTLHPNMAGVVIIR